MNTNQLKKFAQDARRKLLTQVGAKLEYVLTHDTISMMRSYRSVTGRLQGSYRAVTGRLQGKISD